jgi:alpha-ribazole phosphatase
MDDGSWNIRMKIYLVRHGQTEYNIKGVYYGFTDAELTEKGRSQAVRTGELLKDCQIDLCISSPLKRASETARLALEGRKVRINLEERFKEQNFGEWEGLSYKEIWEKYPQQAKQWGDDWMGTVLPGGESFLEFYHRVSEGIKEILSLNKEENILIVGHNGSLRVIACELLKFKKEQFWYFNFEQACYSMIEYEDDYPVIRCINCGFEERK